MYKCSICGKEYKNPLLADGCEKSHDVIFVRMNKSDLFRLVQFIYTGNRELLTESLMKTLVDHTRGK